MTYKELLESLQKLNENALSKNAIVYDIDDQEFKEITLSNYKGKWVVLFFYPLDFTFVCPTEFVEYANLNLEFL